MLDPDKKDGDPKPNPNPNPDPPGGGPGGEHMIPKSRLDEVLAKQRELQAKLDEQAEAQRKADEKRQEEEGKWKDLAGKRETEREAASAEAKQAQAASQKLALRLHNAIDAEIKDWPEKLRAKIPTREACEDAEARAAKVDELRDLVGEFAADARTPGNGRVPPPAGGSNPAETAKAARAHVLSRRSYQM